jgi:hypothetical protein
MVHQYASRRIHDGDLVTHAAQDAELTVQDATDNFRLGGAVIRSAKRETAPLLLGQVHLGAVHIAGIQHPGPQRCVAPDDPAGMQDDTLVAIRASTTRDATTAYP